MGDVWVLGSVEAGYFVVFRASEVALRDTANRAPVRRYRDLRFISQVEGLRGPAYSAGSPSHMRGIPVVPCRRVHG